MAKFTVEHTVSDQFIGDVLTTALESSSIDYWADISNVCRVTSEGGDIERLTVLSFNVSDSEAYDGEEPAFPNHTPVNFLTVILGITRILNGTVGVGSTVRENVARAVADNDPDLDAIDTDCIVQAGLFNQIVFD